MTTVQTYAPGRAELLGNHTDYNDGLVLSLAISFGTTMRAKPLPDNKLVLRSQDLKREWSGDLGRIEPQKTESWANYVLGVLDQLGKRGVRLGGAELEISSNIPIGAGLSSSAALEIATALSMQKLYPFEMSRLDLARVGQAAEHTYAGVKCGLLDQISVALSRKGHATSIDCRSFEIGHLPLDPAYEFVIAHSGVKHALVAGEYNERRESCENAARLLGKSALRDVTPSELELAREKLPEHAYMRAKHVVGEIDRVTRAKGYLEAGRMEEFGKLMYESHESSIRYFENSCEELDFLVATAKGLKGCLGARLSGGGFGGATLNLVRRDCLKEFCGKLAEAYRKHHGSEPMILPTDACDGAS